MKQKQPDWNAIRAEYIRDESTSYRKLSKKHEVSEVTLTRRAVKEKWVELRRQSNSKTIAKTLEKISDNRADTAKEFEELATEIMKQVSQRVREGPLDVLSILRIVSSLKDIKEILEIRLTEQSEENTNTGVVFLPSVSDNREVNSGE